MMNTGRESAGSLARAAGLVGRMLRRLGRAVTGFDTGFEVEYRPWQVRLLLASSLALVAAARLALAEGAPRTAAAVGASAAASLNYWRAPGAGWRRNLDCACASVAVAFGLLVGQALSGALNAAYWAGLLGFVVCFRASVRLSTVAGNVVWAKWHAAGHACISASIVCGVLGRCEERWLAQPSPVRAPLENPLAAAAIAVCLGSLGSNLART
jgi:hypothetical protein